MEYDIPSERTLYVFAKGFENSCDVFVEDEQSQWFFQQNAQGTRTINVSVFSDDNQLRIGIAYGPPKEPGPGAFEEWQKMATILFDECEDI